MRLKWLQRVGLIILGAAALGGAITLSIMDLGGAAAIAAVIGLIFPGFLLITFGLIGIFPNVNLKEGDIDWAKIEPVGGYLAKEEWEQQRKIIADERTGSVDTLRKELETVSTRLEDYILAHQPPPPPEEGEEELSDEDRLEEMQQAFIELDQSLSLHRYYGDAHGGHRRDRDSARDALDKEERRQQAQYTFGMRDKPPKSIYDDP